MRIDAEHSDPPGPASPSSRFSQERRSVWSEHLELRDLCDASLLRLLAKRRVELVAAVRPGGTSDIPALVEATSEHGVPLTLWPMLDDEDGRWLSATNADRFLRFTDDVVRASHSAQTPAPELVLDLEPPIQAMRRWLRHPLRSIARPPKPVKGDPIQRVVDHLARGGVDPWAAVVPLVTADPGPHRPGGWQSLLQTTVDPHPFSRVNAMLYTTLAEGYSRGLLRRQDVRSLLFETARACARRWGPRASASLGAVGRGALGDERVYTGVDELADDVALVRAAGINDIALFELSGVLARPPAEAWFDALWGTDAPAPLPHRSRRVLLALAVAVGIGYSLS